MVEKDVIARVRINKSNNQMSITVPINSKLKPGDMVKLVKVNVKIEVAK